MYPVNTIIEGHNLVKTSEEFKKEVANTTENIAKPRYTQYDKTTLEQSKASRESWDK